MKRSCLELLVLRIIYSSLFTERSAQVADYNTRIAITVRTNVGGTVKQFFLYKERHICSSLIDGKSDWAHCFMSSIWIFGKLKDRSGM
jgi:hypothetical protein